jgi:hypothetical protein
MMGLYQVGNPNYVEPETFEKQLRETYTRIIGDSFCHVILKNTSGGGIVDLVLDNLSFNAHIVKLMSLGSYISSYEVRMFKKGFSYIFHHR